MSERWSKVALLFAVGLTGCIKPPAALPAEAEVPAADAPAWEARSLGDLYQVGKVRHWELRQGGQRLGHSFGRLVGEDQASGHFTFETRIELEIPGRPPIRSEGRLVLDRDGRLVKGVERSDAAELTFRVDGKVLHLESGGVSDEVTYDPQRVDTAFWADTAILHEEIMLNTRTIRRGDNEWRLLSLSGGVPVEWSGEVKVANDGALFIETSLGESIEFRQGKLARIRVAADDLDVVGDDTVAWPEWSITGPRKLTYKPPADAKFSITQVELPGKAGQPRLFAEVLLPAGKGPHPGVVFLTGAGQQDRYGFSGPPPVDLGSHAITDALAQGGFAVIRYDERGFGRSEKGELSFSAQLDDGRAALGMLLVQEGVDPDRILLVGHGEGGWRALILAGERAEVRGVAMLGSPGRRYAEILAHQMEQTLLDLPPEVRADARSTSQMMIDALASDKPAPPELIAQEKWLREIMAIDPARLFRSTKAKIWLAQGAKDFEVDPVKDVAELERAARSAGRKVDVVQYPTLDHLFMAEAQRSTPARYLKDGREVDAAFLRDLVSWTTRLFD